MGSMNYRFLTPALSELAEAADYYEEKVTGLGADFIDEVEAAISRIQQFPQAWGRISERYRHCQLRRFPYSIVYAEGGDYEIVVISIFHQSREPMSWQRNL